MVRAGRALNSGRLRRTRTLRMRTAFSFAAFSGYHLASAACLLLNTFLLLLRVLSLAVVAEHRSARMELLGFDGESVLRVTSSEQPLGQMQDEAGTWDFN